MDSDDRLELVKKNTEEIITLAELEQLLKSKKGGKAYYGIATTGPFHMAYLVPLGKVFDFEKADIRTTILLADVHAAMDDLKSSWQDLAKKADYYKKCIELSLPWKEKPKFVKGSEFQLSSDYLTDVIKMSTLITVTRATRAASEVTRMKNAKVSEIIYPIMQALDEQYLKADVQYGGVDQRKIFMYARENLHKVGYKPRIEVMTPILPGLTGKKMSASDAKSKIDFLDDETTVKNKLKKAYCESGVVEDNGVLAFLKNVIMVLKEYKSEKFIVERPEKFGGNVEFKSYQEIEDAFVKKKLHPLDLKNALAKEVNNLLEPFRKNKAKLEKIAKEAYD